MAVIIRFTELADPFWKGLSMENSILIISLMTLIISSLAIIMSTILLTLLIKRKSTNGGAFSFDTKNLEKEQIQSAAEIKAAVENLEKNLSLKFEGQINEKMKDQILEITKAMKEGAEIDTKRLNDFQQTMTNNLNERVSTMDETVSRRLLDVTSKINEQMNAMQQSMKSLTEADTARLNNFQSTINETMVLQMKTMNERIDASMRTINEKVNQSLNDGFKGTSDSMISLQKQLGMVQEAQKSINTLQGEITSLKDVLNNNQQRGRYGEFQLEMLLDNLFQGSKGVLYDTQFILQAAKGDEPQLKPDAVIFLDGEAHHQIVCIDSKFSLAGYEELFNHSKPLGEAEINNAKLAFKNATKLRIDETAKYIIKGKTISNALMFIPNDGVFAYIHNEFPDLVEHAQRRNVVMVSPTILQPLLASFRVIQIDAKKSKNINLINEQLNALAKEFVKFMPRWKSLNDSIQNLTKKSDQFDTTVNKISKKFDRVQTIDFDKNEIDGITENREDSNQITMDKALESDMG